MSVLIDLKWGSNKGVVMTKEQFLELLKEKGYTEGDYDLKGYHVKYRKNVIIKVNDKSYSRIICFDTGNLGHVETLPFNKTKLL
jgi:hypothetical protein